MAVSLKPSTFVEAGLLDDADVQITDVAFCIWNYGGQGPQTLALGVEFTEVHAQPDGTRKKHEQYYSAGDMAYFRPSPDGATLEPVSDKTAMNSNTNAATFISSLVKAGFPESQFESGSIKVIKGLTVHVNRVPQPKRPGIKRSEGDDKERTVLVVSRILSGAAVGGMNPAGATGAMMPPPSPFASAPGNASSTPSYPPAPVAAAAGPFAAAPVGMTAPIPTQAQTPNPNAGPSRAGAVLLDVLIKNGGKIEKSKLPGEVFRATVNQPDQGALVSQLFDDAVLSTLPGIRYDGATITLA